MRQVLKYDLICYAAGAAVHLAGSSLPSLTLPSLLQTRTGL